MCAWLMKSEPDVFSFDDLYQRPGRKEPWDGVRNYQARNFMRDRMQVGDPVLFYHSNCAEPGIVGLAKVASKPRPDLTAQDPKSNYFDPKATAEDPRWVLVDVAYHKRFKRIVTLAQMKEEKALEGMQLLARGNRLSILPVEEAHFAHICSLGGV